MAAIYSVLVILTLSIFVTRIAAVALALTGLSREVASFQARSAFTGVGFTTAEAESAINHPVRRRIIATLMLLGNVGVVAGVSTVILGFVNIREQEIGGWARFGVLGLGATILFFLARSRLVDRVLSRFVHWAMRRWTHMEIRDYAELLHLTGEYGVRTIRVHEGDWLADRTLGDCKVRDEGANILGIEKPDGSYVGVPRGDTRVEPDDVLLAYGRLDSLTDLASRSRGAGGDIAHEQAVEVELEMRQSEAEAEERHETRPKP